MDYLEYYQHLEERLTQLGQEMPGPMTGFARLHKKALSDGIAERKNQGIDGGSDQYRRALRGLYRLPCTRCSRSWRHAPGTAGDDRGSAFDGWWTGLDVRRANYGCNRTIPA